jgi:peptide alpha-N-acetyltransferase
MFDSQYLQQHSSDATALLAIARVLKMLHSPLSEVENMIFGILDDGVEVDVDVSRCLSVVPNSTLKRKNLDCKNRC